MFPLTDVQTLAEHLADPAWVIVDCRFDLTDTGKGRLQYQDGHIPRARYAHLDEDLSGERRPDCGRHPLPDPEVFAARMRGWGVGRDDTVVAYDAGNGAIAARLWWLSRWIGHDAVCVLDGGFAAWLEYDGAVDRRIPATRRGDITAEPRQDMLLGTEQVSEHLHSGGMLMDARTAARFRGEAEPIDPVAGHIPGAVNRPFQENLADDGRFLSAEVLRRQFEVAGAATAPHRVLHMCGSGVTACHNLLAMEAAGLHGSLLYPGSWSEWITDPGRPVATG